MNKRRISLLILSSVWLAACAVGYQASGQLSDHAGQLHGKGYPANTIGGGRFSLGDPARSLSCDGELAPPDITPSPSHCIGEGGQGLVRCSDGRAFAVRWRALSCRSFEGEGEDQAGRRLVFRVERR